MNKEHPHAEMRFSPQKSREDLSYVVTWACTAGIMLRERSESSKDLAYRRMRIFSEMIEMLSTLVLVMVSQKEAYVHCIKIFFLSIMPQ